MVLSLKDKWIWDFWLARDGGDWHIYFLQADKSLTDPDLRHTNVSQGHAVSPDLINWTHLGTCFEPAPEPAFDDCTTWTGSVIKGKSGVWHLFYTGTSLADNGLKQRIGHATSTDMHTWNRVGTGLALDISGPDYEDYTPGHWHDRAMRDPWVIKDPAGGGYLMYFTGRVTGRAEANAAGVIGFATSPDLHTWTLRPPIYDGAQFGQMEVPQVFSIDGRWYCLFCTAAAHWSKAYARSYPGPAVCGTHYLVAEDPRGPWQIAPAPFLDGAQPCNRYAGRVVETGDGLIFMGFVHNPDGRRFVGIVCDPIPIEIGGGGFLELKPDKRGSSLRSAI